MVGADSTYPAPCVPANPNSTHFAPLVIGFAGINVEALAGILKRGTTRQGSVVFYLRVSFICIIG
ncbi:MAG TPA: hypothetical protein VGR15_09245 [Bacteroidota bacterium]|nr:hypothetical protein [Bacteroidota bacterium]